MKSFWRKILDIFFPKRCINCRQFRAYLCSECAAKLPYCEKIIPSWIISIWSYKDPRIKRLLWQFKFENKFSIAEDLAVFAADHLIAELADRAIFENITDITLVPIPLSKKSRKARGYNQSEILAKEIARGLGDGYKTRDLLMKVRDTETQHSIKNRRTRLQNLRGAYAAKNSEEVAGKNILLVDDITTTHATLVEARRALREAGARKVLAFTIAH